MKELKSYAKIWQVILCLALCFMSLIPHFITADIHPVDYPILTEDLAYRDAYIQQFDAFKKGQLNIDIEPKEDLLNLDNPYDWDQRKENGVFYLWDRALYNGKYYSYFGIAPIITVYMPFYALSGHLPTPTICCFILALLGIIGIFFAYYNLLRFFKIHPPSYIFLTGLIAVEFGSLLPMLFSSADMYYIASTSAIVNLSLFLAFFFAAMLQKSSKRRYVFFVLSSLCFALLLMSRPGLCIFGFIIVPCLLSIIFTKELNLKKKILSLISLALPLTAGLTVTGILNYMRFGSVFDFGAAYQLTVYDVSKYSITPHLLIPCLVFYFLQLPSFKSSFPFIQLKLASIPIYVPYLYRTYTIGTLAFPANLGVFALSGIIAKPRKVNICQKATYLLAFICVFALAFVDICMGGVNIRYFADISFVMVLFSVLILSETPSIFADSKKFLRVTFNIVIMILFILTALMGFLLIFENERNYILTAISQLKAQGAVSF